MTPRMKMRPFNYWQFQAGTATSILASTSQQIVTATGIIPVPQDSYARLISAYTTISTTDGSGSLVLDALSLFYFMTNQTGGLLIGVPLPVFFVPTLGTLAGATVRYASGDTPERIDVIPSGQVVAAAANTFSAGVLVEVIALVRNTDAANPHTVTVNVGDIVGVGKL
jgi:hypothetical protein